MPAKNSAADDGYVHDKREQDAMRGQEGLGLGLPRRRREVVVRFILLVKRRDPLQGWWCGRISPAANYETT